MDRSASADFGGPARDRYAILDLESGEFAPVTFGGQDRTPADASRSGSETPLTLTGAVFSPDGGSLAMVAARPGDPQRLLIRDLETGTDTLAGELDQIVGQFDFRSGLDWGENDIVLGFGPAMSGVLLTLAIA
jgi:hypothetical protein